MVIFKIVYYDKILDEHQYQLNVFTNILHFYVGIKLIFEAAAS